VKIGIRAYDPAMPSIEVFWPSNRHLFRQRSLVRRFLPVAVVVLLACLVLAFKGTGAA
jgi:hypothetical protein